MSTRVRRTTVSAAKQKPNNNSGPKLVPALVGAVLVGLVIYWLVQRSKPQRPQAFISSAATSAQPTAQQLQADADAQVQQTAQQVQAGQGFGQQQPSLAQQAQPDMVYGPQPSDLSFQEYTGDLDFAPVFTTRGNEFLSQANPELTQFDSGALLPNATLQACENGQITGAPAFNQLNVFSGNKLFEASMAERYFTEIQPRKVISLADLRPLPLIGSSSATAVPWNQSSLNINDTAGGLAHFNTAFCSQNQFPAGQVTTPMPGAMTPIPGMPQQTTPS